MKYLFLVIAVLFSLNAKADLKSVVYGLRMGTTAQQVLNILGNPTSFQPGEESHMVYTDQTTNCILSFKKHLISNTYCKASYE